MKKRYAAASIALFIGLTGCQTGGPLTNEVDLFNASGDKLGTATLTEKADGVSIKLDVSGLEPGPHGFHIHENPKCEGPEFKSAGGHFNPEDKDHGLLNTEGSHAGDLKNIDADDAGKVDVTLKASDLTLKEGGKNSLLDNGGTALVIHAGVDDGMTDPAGNAGKRVACGEIKPKSEKDSGEEEKED